MTTEDMIEVMQGFVAGRVLEVRPLPRDLDEWWVKTAAPKWDWMHYDYRLAPERDIKPKTLWVNEYSDKCGGYGYTDKESAMRNRSTVHSRQVVEYREVKA